MPGPYVTVAALCENVLVDVTNALSLIRIVDRIDHTHMGSEVPDQMPPVPINLKVVIALKPGDARGRHALKLRPEAPSGQQHVAIEVPVLFESEDRGVNLTANLGMQLDQEGLWWFDVLLNEDQLLTRIPLRLAYNPQRTSFGSGP